LATQKFAPYFNVFVCDTNPDYLVPSSSLAKDFFQVPPIGNPEYREHMLDLFRRYGINVFVPLIDADIHTFPTDFPDLTKLGVRCTGVSSDVSRMIRNKRTLMGVLNSNGISTPKTLSQSDLREQGVGTFFVKPETGFGSQGVFTANTAQALAALEAHSGLLVQELCSGPEYTVEVFNQDAVLSICRERLQTKSGVCTKARVFSDSTLHSIAERLTKLFALPVAFCFQVMSRENGEFVLTDLNPRLGAGTALSTACGWSLASAALATWGQIPGDSQTYLSTPRRQQFVVRVFQEILMEKEC
jgi:hypothetical protein